MVVIFGYAIGKVGLIALSSLLVLAGVHIWGELDPTTQTSIEGYLGSTWESFVNFISGALAWLMNAVMITILSIYEVLILPILRIGKLEPVADAVFYIFGSLMSLVKFGFQNVGMLFICSQLVIILITMREYDLTGYVSTFLALEWGLLSMLFMFVYFMVGLAYQAILGSGRFITSLYQVIRG